MLTQKMTNNIQQQSVTSRVAWSLAEISKATNLSVSFLRYEIERGFLKARKFGRRVLVLDTDLQEYMQSGSDGGKQVDDAA
jgi:excisionase family DNA binding protein